MRVLKQCVPNYNKLKIHESSPTFRRGVSPRLRRECPNYTYSYFYPDVPLGELHPEQNVRCENLERLSFDDGSFDLFLSQDVMEHVFNPEPAFIQIARALKPGGMHIFTVPLVNKFRATQVRSSQLPSGEVVHHLEPKYHGNPINRKSGSLMTMSWGYDIASSIVEWTGMPTIVMQIDDIHHGIRADLIEVVVSRKPDAA